ncbi:MAG: class I SAM-dependent methyltransferase [bacterium]|nr:class I SAM-dependent methyltransferase [bacterium]
MNNHLEQLTHYLPDLFDRRMLDLGSGRGKFVLAVAALGGEVVGLEFNPSYITTTLDQAKKLNLKIEVHQGVGEKLLFAGQEFGFINVAEVLEHVVDPVAVLTEVYRVLAPGGYVYLSVPNRFGLKDQHFHLYGVNWLPRFWSDLYINLFGRHKNYESQAAGVQRLSEMHYYTFNQITNLVIQLGFEVEDIRAKHLRRRFFGLWFYLVYPFYRLLRPWYFDSFHLLLHKPLNQA